jgi:hypothetical protein
MAAAALAMAVPPMPVKCTDLIADENMVKNYREFSGAEKEESDRLKVVREHECEIASQLRAAQGVLAHE